MQHPFPVVGRVQFEKGSEEMQETTLITHHSFCCSVGCTIVYFHVCLLPLSMEPAKAATQALPQCLDGDPGQHLLFYTSLVTIHSLEVQDSTTREADGRPHQPIR